MNHTTECPANYDRCTCGRVDLIENPGSVGEHKSGCYLYLPEAVCTCGAWEADKARIEAEDLARREAWKAQVKALNKPTSHLSAYDDPAPLPGDPLPKEGEEMTPMQLAHHRIEYDIAMTRDIQKADANAWRTSFNNLANNVRGLLNAFDQTLKREQVARLEMASRLKKLEKRVR